MISRYLPRDAIVGRMPLGFFCGLLTVSIGLTLTQATNVRPLIWWRRRFEMLIKPLPTYLPDVQIFADEKNNCIVVLPDGRKKICVKCGGVDLLKLDHIQREDLSTIFTSSLSGCRNVQIVFGSIGGRNASTHFYIIADLVEEQETNAALLELSEDPSSMINALALTDGGSPTRLGMTKLKQAGLELLPVSPDELRAMLFACLSPSHFARGEPVPPSKDQMGETLTLCKTGFMQRRNYLIIDEKHCAVLKMTKLPVETYVGWLRSLLNIDGSFSTSLHFSFCDQNIARDQVRSDIRLVLATRSNVAPMDGLMEMRRFVEGGHTAFDFSCYTMVYASTYDGLKLAVSAAKQAASQSGAIFEIADLEQLDGLISALPLGYDKLHATHRILSPVVGTCWPFVAAAVSPN